MSETAIVRAEVLVYAAGVSCDTAALLQDAARANRLESLMLKVRAQEVRGARRLCGGSERDEPSLSILSPPTMSDDFTGAQDAAVVAKILLGGTFCISCIAAKTPFDQASVRSLIEDVGAYMRVTRKTVLSCDGCSTVAVAYGLI